MANFNADDKVRIKDYLPNISGAGMDPELIRWLTYAHNYMVVGLGQYGQATPAVDGSADEIFLDMEAHIAAGRYLHSVRIPADDDGREREHPVYTDAKKIWADFLVAKYKETEAAQDTPFQRGTDSRTM